MQSASFWAAVTAYAISSAAFFAALAFRKVRFGALGQWLAAVGLLPHGIAVGLRWAEVGHGPYNTRYEVLSADALLLVAAYVAASSFARGIRPLGAFVM